MLLEVTGAASLMGPMLCALGIAGLLLAAVVHGLCRWPTILASRPEADASPPSGAERLSVHLLFYSGWAVGFGAVIWRGVPANGIDVRLPFEKHWGVIEAAEWFYLSVYLVPLLLPWLDVTRGALRRYALNLWWLLAISVACYLLLPCVAPPRPFIPGSLAGEILAWETGRADFAAASLPSFHVFWALLGAALLATRGGWRARAGWIWAVAVAVSCVANGAHALADVAASGLIYAGVAAGFFRLAPARPRTNPSTKPATSAPAPK